MMLLHLHVNLNANDDDDDDDDDNYGFLQESSSCITSWKGNCTVMQNQSSFPLSFKENWSILSVNLPAHFKHNTIPRFIEAQ